MQCSNRQPDQSDRLPSGSVNHEFTKHAQWVRGAWVAWAGVAGVADDGCLRRRAPQDFVSFSVHELTTSKDNGSAASATPSCLAFTGGVPGGQAAHAGDVWRSAVQDAKPTSSVQNAQKLRAAYYRMPRTMPQRYRERDGRDLQSSSSDAKRRRRRRRRRLPGSLQAVHSATPPTRLGQERSDEAPPII